MRVPGFGQARLIAAKEFGDRFRSGWVISCIVVWLGAIGLTSFLGLLQVGQIGVQGYERTVVSLLNLTQYFVPLLGLLLGHDLLAGENEERTLRMLLAGGVGRTWLVFGKFVGGCLTLSVPLLLGFAIAGSAIGLATNEGGFGSFLTLAISTLGLGIVFVGVGLVISSFSRTRVQALVAALLMWCGVVFVFDLVALGMIVSSQSVPAAGEIEVLCDTTHVNAMADIHSAFESVPERGARNDAAMATAGNGNSTAAWLALNPVDLFRIVNLSRDAQPSLSGPAIVFLAGLWLAFPLLAAAWKVRRTDY